MIIKKLWRKTKINKGDKIIRMLIKEERGEEGKNDHVSGIQINNEIFNLI